MYLFIYIYSLYQACFKELHFSVNKNRYINIRFVNKKYLSFYSKLYFLRFMLMRLFFLFYVVDFHVRSNEFQIIRFGGNIVGVKKYSNIPRKGWDNVEMGKKLSRIPKDFITVIWRSTNFRTPEVRRNCRSESPTCHWEVLKFVDWVIRRRLSSHSASSSRSIQFREREPPHKKRQWEL